MTLKHATEPHLAALRIASENLRTNPGASGPARNLERARFALFCAIEREDLAGAAAWLAAVEVAVRTLPDDAVQALLLGAVEAIGAAIQIETAEEVE